MRSLDYSENQMKNNLLRTYKGSDSVVIYRTKEDFGGLSNMASGYPLFINDMLILSTEALYQACRFPHLPNVQREIINQHSPITAKMMSRSYRKMSRTDWDQIRYKIMRWCLRVKLAQNYDSFGQLLLNTCDRPIVEKSRKDDYWGAKLVDHSGETLVGQNVLGRLLMELRDRLKEDKDNKLKTVPVPTITQFILFNRNIETVTACNKIRNQNKQPSLF